jgi:uncharacterized protein (TIGR03437 family)
MCSKDSAPIIQIMKRFGSITKLTLAFLTLAALLSLSEQQRGAKASAPFAAAAVQSNSISCGQTLTGNISAAGQQDVYTFSTNAGEAVIIAAIATSGTLSARLELYSPSNTLIASNGGGNTSTGSVKLTATGVYIILVRDNFLSRAGRYSLNLQFTTGRCSAPIAGGQILSGSINSVAKQDSFVFFGRQGGSVIISAIATSGTLSARLEVYSPSNMLIASNGGGNTSTGNVAIQETGIHIILVRDNFLSRTGNYNLSLTCLGNGCPPAVTIALAPTSQAIPPGSTGNLTVTISPAQSTATTVTLNSTNPAVVTVAASVTMTANATTASFAVTGVALGTATIIAALPMNLGGSANASVTVAQPCQPISSLPGGYVPFTQISYITGPNGNGDRLVVGKLPLSQLSPVPLPGLSEQRFCTPLQLVTGLSAISYVPTAAERSGDFSAFAGQLIDPVTGAPLPAGLIPANRLGDVHAWRIVNLVGSPATVSGASYSAVALASESIASAFGARLATATASAPSQPLPTILAGTTVKVIDSKAVSRNAPLFFVSPDQVNFQIPVGTSVGAATIIITNGDGSVFIGVTQIATIAPGLFTANADGQGVAAAEAVRVASNGSQSPVTVLQLDQAHNKFVPVPMDLGPDTEQVFLILYGTGFRFREMPGVVTCLIGGVAAEVSYAGNQNQYVGLDQCNVRIPRSLIDAAKWMSN